MRSRLPFTALLASACFVLARVAHAQQVVVVDATYTHSATTTHDSHYTLSPPADTPSDWTSPVNYAGGQVYVRLEVKTKPSDAATRFQVCFGSHPNYACTDQSMPYTAITAPDAITWATPFANFYKPGPVDWSQGIDSVSLILKDTNNVKPAPENVGDTESAKYLPTDLRVTVTVVAPNTTYQPPAQPVEDAGAGDAAVGSDAAQAPAQPPATTSDAGAHERDAASASAGASAAGGGGNAGATTPQDAGTAPTTRAAPSSKHARSSGCSVGAVASGRSAGTPWLALGMLAFARRARSRSAKLRQRGNPFQGIARRVGDERR